MEDEIMKEDENQNGLEEKVRAFSVRELPESVVRIFFGMDYLSNDYNHNNGRVEGEKLSVLYPYVVEKDRYNGS